MEDRRIAKSLAEADLGQILVLDRRGGTLSPRSVKLHGASGWAVIGASAGVVALCTVAVAGPVMGAIYTGVFVAILGVMTALRMPAIRTVQRAASLTAEGKFEEGYELLVSLDKRTKQRAMRGTRERLMCACEMLLGRTADALARADRLLAEYGHPELEIELTKHLRVEALILLGRIDDARKALAELARGLPGELFVYLRESARLMLAFHAESPALLPDDAALHEQAKAALGRTRYGETLILLAWAFEQRNDLDMARHLLGEAPSRMKASRLSTYDPKRHRSMIEKMRAWEID
jgi:hypothetical protein